MIKSIEKHSTAYKMGLRENFMLIEVNGVSTPHKSYFDANRLIKTHSPNGSMVFSVIKFNKIHVKIPPNMNSFGLSISYAKEKNFKMIVKIEHHLPADLYGIKESDIIFQINAYL